MLSWVVNFRLHPRLATLFRHVTKSRSPQVLLDSALTNGDARNSFRIRSYENCRVSPGPLNIPTLKPFNLPTFTDLSLFLSHSCALFCAYEKLNPFLFKQIRALSRKHPGVGYSAFPTRIKMNVAETRFRFAISPPCPILGDSTVLMNAPHPRFASPHPRFLVNYIDPIPRRAGLREYIPISPRGPRS